MKIAVACLMFLLAAGSEAAASPDAADTAFEAYAGMLEARLAVQHRSADGFLQPAKPDPDRPILDRIDTSNLHLPGAMLHHWRGTAFAPAAKAADFERLLRDVAAYPRIFAPEVEDAQIREANGDRMETRMRVRQRHVITVVLDTEYDVTFGRLDAGHGYSASRSTRISELGEQHGFLRRLNTYWSYAEGDGGIWLQIENLSLSRSIPRGLGWVVEPYVESIPRESIGFTLNAVCKALRRGDV
jgi:hypothetical protein